MADALLIFVTILLVIAGGFAVVYVRTAARRKERILLRQARRAALADISASAEYVQAVNDATTIEELERLAEEREEGLWAGSLSASSWRSRGFS
jgi:hypothetical protein